MGCFKKNGISMAGQNHERYLGSGYPNGLAKDENEYFARICKVMDVYDALTTRRSYKKALTTMDAFTIMKKEMQGHFDPNILDKFILIMGLEN
ncbi:MAG: HD domain-containing phosphohydrolase [Nitrospinota bacterium]